MYNKDYIIVGQGVTGSLLAYFLLKHDKDILVIDNDYKRAASKIAAGIINPITGRRFVKSWMFDTLLPFAEKTYIDIEQLLGITFFYKKNIIRILQNPREENDWKMRMLIPSYSKYNCKKVDLGNYIQATEQGYSTIELKETAQVQLPIFIKNYRQYLLKNGLLQSECFEYDRLEINVDNVQYKNNIAKKIIFCEGRHGKQNPYFNYLPFEPAKGERLLVEIPNANFKKMYKNGVYIVPVEKDIYWIGSTNQHHSTDDIPTKESELFLRKRLEKILKKPFKIINHEASIRPTIKDRRPLLGLHPNYPVLGILNGMGTKGASLAPFFANQMSNFLEGYSDLNKEVDISRVDKNL